jgi:N-acetylmuramate 1-kinase
VMIAELVTIALRRGDRIELEGDLGAGKSTFARAVIRAALDDPAADVPSPTFSLVQSYPTPRLEITHADLYRLSEPSEVDELGLVEACHSGAVLVEWPERGRGPGPASFDGAGLVVRLDDLDVSSVRRITLTAHGSFRPRLARLMDVWEFLHTAWPEAMPVRIRYLQGDASARAYARISSATGSVRGTRVLMDSPRQPDGPAVRDGLSYSRIAHLAEDVRAFVAVGGHLERAGVLVPAVQAHDLDRGLLLLDDLGDGVFSRLIADGCDQRALWTDAVDTLVALRTASPGHSLPLPDGSTHVLPRYDGNALAIETELLIDWLWPAEYGGAAPDAISASFRWAWMPILRRLASMGDGLVLRDFHSPNLLRVPAVGGTPRLGVIDFQDAVLGPLAYDLASLLLDARVDVPEDLAAELLERYCERAKAAVPLFDERNFRFAFAALGVQRNTKILGIFARLSRRDGKHGYLVHLPRIWRYLERGLGHPELAGLKAWYDQHWPAHTRRQLPSP